MRLTRATTSTQESLVPVVLSRLRSCRLLDSLCGLLAKFARTPLEKRSAAPPGCARLLGASSCLHRFGGRAKEHAGGSGSVSDRARSCARSHQCSVSARTTLLVVCAHSTCSEVLLAIVLSAEVCPNTSSLVLCAPTRDCGDCEENNVQTIGSELSALEHCNIWYPVKYRQLYMIIRMVVGFWAESNTDFTYSIYFIPFFCTKQRLSRKSLHKAKRVGLFKE